MLIPDACRRLCEVTVSLYRFSIFFHDAQGKLLFAVPQHEEAYIQEYIGNSMYQHLMQALPESGHPVIVSNITTDVWTGFPVAYETGEAGMLVLGPVFYSDISPQVLQDILRTSSVSPQTRLLLERHKDELPVISYNEYIRVIRQLYYTLTGKTLDPMRLGLATLPTVREDVAKVSQQHTQMLFDETMVHATYSFERYMLSCIREGNPAKLIRHLNSGMPGSEGVLSKGDPIRQTKNMFIVAATLTTRAAIEGGLNPEIAMSLSDLFIQQIEQMHDAQKILLCQNEMIMDFTRRVEEINLQQRYSKTVAECCQYIQEHVYQNIRVGDIASHVHLSENYVSVKFKEETGQSITSFIKQAKVAEAKNLLRYTGLTLLEISALLSYSSQSFFSTVFRQETGCTPMQYRQQGEKEQE